MSVEERKVKTRVKTKLTKASKEFLFVYKVKNWSKSKSKTLLKIGLSDLEHEDVSSSGKKLRKFFLLKFQITAASLQNNYPSNISPKRMYVKI